MDPNIGANLPEEERRRLHEQFDAAVLEVRREEASRRDEERPHNQQDQPRGGAVQSLEHPTRVPAQAQQHQWATGPLPGMYRISSSIRPKLFDGMFKNGEEVQQTVMVFVNQMLAHFGEGGCLDAVGRDVPIKVASAGVSAEALKREFGEEAVARARVAWKILINQISYPTILKLIIAAGSPSEGWSIFKKFYAPQAAAEKARLTQSWYSLRMKQHEPPNEYFARGSALRSRLALHGVTFSDVDANQEFARNLSHVFGVQKSILLSNAGVRLRANSWFASTSENVTPCSASRLLSTLRRAKYSLGGSCCFIRRLYHD